MRYEMTITPRDGGRFHVFRDTVKYLAVRTASRNHGRFGGLSINNENNRMSFVVETGEPETLRTNFSTLGDVTYREL